MAIKLGSSNFLSGYVGSNPVQVIKLGTQDAFISTPLRVAEIQARPPNNLTNSSGKDGLVFVWPFIIGDDYHDIVVVLDNWYLNVSAENSPGNSTTYQSIAIIAPNGTVVPVYFSGSRSVTLTSGQAFVKSDPIPRLVFGINISRGSTGWKIKGNSTVPVSGNNFVCHDAIQINDYLSPTTAQIGFYNTSATTPSTTDADGFYTATGTAFTAGNFGPKPIIMGHPIVDGRSVVAVGDSIGERLDDANRGIYGRAFVQIATANYGTDPYPCLNMCRASARTGLFTGGTRWRNYDDAGYNAVVELGTNELNDNVSAADTLTRIDNVISMLNVEKVIVTEVMCRTTSTDGFATKANQTYYTNYGPGTASEGINAGFTARIGINIDAVVSMAAVCDPTDRWKWRTDSLSTAGLATADGLHPSSWAMAVAGAELRPYIDITTFDYNKLGGATLVLNALDKTTILDANGNNADNVSFLGTVATWRDQSQYLNHVTQSTAGSRAAYAAATIGSVVCPELDGSNDFWSIPTAVFVFQGSTDIVIYRPDTTTAAQHLIGGSGIGANSNRYQISNQQIDYGQTALARLSAASGVTVAQVSRVRSTSSTRQWIKINSDAERTGTVTRNGLLAPFCLGALGNGTTGYFDGRIGLVMHFNRVLAFNEINRIMQKAVTDFGVTWSDLAE